MAAELLRVVVAPDATGSAQARPVGTPPQQAALPVVPDPRRRAPGRGAWLHPDPACVELAQRRRAFARALRVPAAVDAAPVLRYVEQHGRTGPASAGTTSDLREETQDMGTR